MARPKKQTVDYFPHYVASGKTLFILENTFGNNGYAFWFKLLEILGSTEGHYYDTNNSADWMFLLAKTKVSEETGTEILKTLAELGAIDSDLWEQKVIWVQNLVDNVSDVYKKRGVAKPSKPSFCDRNTPTPIVSDSENQQSKVKESKVKETKTNNIIDTGDSSLSLLKYMETRGFPFMSPINIEKLNADIEIYSEAEVKKAIDIADENGKHSYAYVKGILERRRAGVNEKIDKEEAFKKAAKEFLEDDSI